MAFWIGILAGGIFAWFAIKLRFYQTWALLFNIIISIYLAIYLRPLITNIPSVSDTPYSNVLTLLVIASASFLIMHGISYTFVTGQFNISFPKVFDTIGTGILGFLAGFLIWSFLSLLIYLTPASQNNILKETGFTSEYQQTSISYISRFCNIVNTFVSSKESKHFAEYTIEQLIKDSAPKKQVKIIVPEEPVKHEPNEPKTSIEEELGPPPEADTKDI